MISIEQIIELREAFLKQLDEHGAAKFHEKDIDRVKKDDKWLRRFLRHQESRQKDALNMLWETALWRKEFGANEINDLVDFNLVKQGGFFPHGKDKDGCTLFVFKCKKYIKGAHSMDELKRCVVYWFERLERQDNGSPITLFFDMENCGFSNLDLDFTRYLIGLFKQYYPYFLNNILMYEMPWILNASLKLIKTWLPEKAVQKMRQMTHKDIGDFIESEYLLIEWGGQNTYVFNFTPESPEMTNSITNMETPVNSYGSKKAKVHFADGASAASMSAATAGGVEGTTTSAGGQSTTVIDKDHHDSDILLVQPSGVLIFVQENGELVSNVELYNSDSSLIVAYKLKTTSPEKFRVRPSVGCLEPGSRTTIQVTLLPGFQLGGLTRDKFLVMSTILQQAECPTPEAVSRIDLNQLWKETSGRKVTQHRLKCAQTNITSNFNNSNNGSALAIGDGPVANVNPTAQSNNVENLTLKLAKLLECQNDIRTVTRRIQYMQLFIIVLVVLLAIGGGWIASGGGNMNQDHQADYCLQRDLISE